MIHFPSILENSHLNGVVGNLSEQLSVSSNEESLRTMLCDDILKNLQTRRPFHRLHPLLHHLKGNLETVLGKRRYGGDDDTSKEG